MGKSSAVKDIISLLIITTIAGLLLSFMYNATKETIEKKAEENQKKAYQSLFENASEFVELNVDKESFQSSLDNPKASILNKALEAVTDSGELVGYLITVTSREGYSGDIDMTVGIELDGTLKGISITKISETAGLGSKANTPAFKEQYEGKNVPSFVVVKTGSRADNEIDSISGATITTKAVTNAINTALKYYLEVISKGGN